MEKIRLVVRGARAGHGAAQVAEVLARLLKQDAAAILRLLEQGRPLSITLPDLATAQRYQALLTQQGCDCAIEPAAATPEPAPAAEPDFSGLDLHAVLNPLLGLQLRLPRAWENRGGRDLFQVVDPASRAQFSASAAKIQTPGESWEAQRLALVTRQMPYLRQVRAPYPLQGAHWSGTAAEYRGVFPGGVTESHYLALCLRLGASPLFLSITAPLAVYERDQALYRWLLRTQLEPCKAQAPPPRVPAAGGAPLALADDSAPDLRARPRTAAPAPTRPPPAPPPRRRGTGIGEYLPHRGVFWFAAVAAALMVRLVLMPHLFFGFRFDNAGQGPKAHAARMPAEPEVFDAGGSIYDLAVSPDGRYLATYTATDTAVWDTWTEGRLWKLAADSPGYAGMGDAVMSRSGHLLVLRSQQALKLFDVPSGKVVATLDGDPGHNWQAAQVVFNHAGTSLLVLSATMQAALYPLEDLDNGAPPRAERKLQPLLLPRPGHLQNGRGMAGFGGDDDSVYLLASDRHLLEVWSTADPPALRQSAEYTRGNMLFPSVFSDDGVLGASCSLDTMSVGTAADASSGLLRLKVPVQLQPGSFHYGTACEISPDRQWFAMAPRANRSEADFHYALMLWHADGSLGLQDLGDAHTHNPAEATKAQVRQLRFSPDANVLYAVDEDGALHLYYLGASLKVALLRPSQLGMDMQGNQVLGPANNGVAVAAGSRAVWVPVAPP